MVWSVTVYGLRSSDDGRIRYVGQTRKSLPLRMKYHLVGAGRWPQRRISKWISSVTRRGAYIQIFPIESSAIENAAEIRWIAWYTKHGADLVNGTCGGEGVSGYKPSPETKEKLRLANLGKRLTPETIAKIRAIHLGRKNSPETKAKMSAAQLGRKSPWLSERNKDPVWQEKARQGRRAYFLVHPKRGPSDEVKKRVSAALKGLVRSAETKEKMSLAKKKWWAERQSHVVA